LKGKGTGSGERTPASSIQLPHGGALGLLGPNGAGKSTAWRLLLGFARPSGGRVRLRGRDRADPVSRAGVGYLSERLRLQARLRVRYALRQPATLASLSGAEHARAVDGARGRRELAAHAGGRG
jgi:ABC-2 type transport system ATP-binding protein